MINSDYDRWPRPQGLPRGCLKQVPAPPAVNFLFIVNTFCINFDLLKNCSKV